MKNIFIQLLIVFTSVSLLSCSSTTPNQDASTDSDMVLGLQALDDGDNSQAKDIFKKVCDSGQRSGCAKLANLLYKEYDFEGPLNYYQKACGLGDLISCSNLGQYFLKERNYKEARIALQKSGKVNFRSQMSLALLDLAENKIKESKKKLEHLCSINISEACRFRGFLAQDEKDYLAAKKYHALASVNNLEVAHSGLIELIIGNKKSGEKLLREACAQRYEPKPCRVVKLLDAEKNNPSLEKDLTEKCNQYDKDACYNLGLHFSLSKNKESLSSNLFKKACNLGNGIGCIELVNSMPQYSSAFVQRLPLIQEACDKGAGGACLMLYYEKLDNHDKTISSDLLLQACTLGNAMGCFEYAGSLWDLNKKDEAIVKYQESCKLNMVEGCYWSEYLSKNEKEQESTAKKFCDKDIVSACRTYASLLKEADALSLAQPYYKKACTLGDLDSCARNLNIEKDTNLAPLSRLCEQKNVLGCFFAGEILYEKNDYVKAKKVFTEGCLLDDASSCEYLGLIHENKTEKVEAIEMFQRACDLGSLYGCKKLYTKE